MYCITLDSDDPFFNLALEEILLKNSEEEYTILGINKPCVVIGKHQSANREVNTKYIIENNIPVIRRISGGGAVYHDSGNLNFTFIRQSEVGKQVDFLKYTQPVINYLLSLGIDAKFGGKNDIKVGRLKISGNAEHVHGNRVLHHGTILFNASLGMLGNCLRKDKSCYTSRAVDSNPSPVLNLNEILLKFSNIHDFKTSMTDYFFHNLPNAEAYNLTLLQKDQAESLANTKYKTWDWNWAYGPEYIFNNRFQLSNKNFSCTLSVKDGIIKECSIVEKGGQLSLSQKLIGCRHMADDVLTVIENEGLLKTKEDIYNFF